MTQIEVSKFYTENEEFKEYVNKYARNRNTTVDVVLKHSVVHNVAEYYSKKIKEVKGTYSV